MTSTYTTQTGVTNTTDEIGVEVVRSRTLRVTDPGYGLKTAAKIGYDQRQAEQRAAQHAEFAAARQTALLRQRDGVTARLTGLRAEISTIVAKLETGTITGSARIDDAFAKLSRMGRAEQRMVDDIARLTTKIGG